MTAFTRELPDSKWVTGFLVPGQILANIDQKTFKAWNGDYGGGGGSWGPTTPIIIGGAGMILCTWTKLLAGAKVLTGPGAHIRHGNADHILIPPGSPFATRVLVQSMLEVFGNQGVGDGAPFVDVVAQMLRTRAPGSRFFVPIRVHHGATVTQVVFSFLPGAHSNVPDVLPQFRVVRMWTDGTVESLRAKDATTDATGFQQFSPRPASGAAWNAAQTFTHVCNQNNVIDATKYRYYAEIIEESGTSSFQASFNNTGTGYQMTTTTNTLIPHFGPQ